ncbi:MAG: hypothetical protein KDH88_05470 [Chromatiales bacterium]|nr:hypothetical protein [Chromatiales bacterium]
MLARLLFRISASLPCRIINGDDGQPYLERYYLFRLGGWTVYLHRFVASDPDRGLHDHPWSRAFGVLLSGGYRELRLGPQNQIRERRLGPGRFNLVKGEDFHRILLSPGERAWTLFAHGPRTKGWGFMGYREEAGSRVLQTEMRAITAKADEHPTRGWWLTAPQGRSAPRSPL